jgi:hypothetical protein
MTNRNDRSHRRSTAARPKKQSQIPGQFVPRLREMLESPAWRVLSKAGRGVIDRIEIELASHGGTRKGQNDNGKLPVTFDDFVAHGIDRHLIAPAIAEDSALGFIEVTDPGRAGNSEFRKPKLFRLTYLPTDGDAEFGTNEWRRIETMEQAREIKAKAREPWRHREIAKAKAAKARKKQESSGGKYPASVGKTPTETAHSIVEKPPLQTMVGKPPLLSISPGGPGSRSAPLGSAVASEPGPSLLSPKVIAAEHEKLIALAISAGRTRAEALVALGMIEEGGPAPASSSSVIEKPVAAPPPPPLPPQTDVAAPAGRQMFMLQKWGVSPARARDLVTRLLAAAGPDRHAHVDDMFAMVDRRPGQSAGRQKIAWLEVQVEKMARWPTYRAQRRLVSKATGRDAIVGALRLAPNHRATAAELAASTGRSLNYIRTTTGFMVKHLELCRVAPGVFTLPQGMPAKPYATAREAILALLIGMSGRYVGTAELVTATGKSRNAIASTASRMAASGELIRGKPGFYALPSIVKARLARRSS